MSTAVVIAFVGALAAAVGTGMHFGRLIRTPRAELAAWSSALLMLGVALGAQAMGYALGFSAVTFRALALAGLLIAPLWTAWGLVELAGRSLSARFGARLAVAALTVVPGVILAMDPLNATPPFDRHWPGLAHYMTLPRTVLNVVHLCAVAAVLVMTAATALRARRDPAWWEVFVPVTVAGAAVLIAVAVGLRLPAPGYPLLTTAAVGMVWFAATRSARVQLGRLRAGRPAEPAPVAGRRRHGRTAAGNGTVSPLTRESFAAAADVGATLADRDFNGPGRPPGTAAGAAVPGSALAGAGREPALVDAAPGWPGHGLPGSAPPGAVTPGQAAPAAATAELFGLIAIYTLLEDQGDDFDRLAERTVEQVRALEPDTLVFVVHTVPKAPMQRIFYEVYRDRMAYKEHRHQPHVVDFFARHRPYVLATNVIELNLRYAKVSALPSLAVMFGRGGGR